MAIKYELFTAEDDTSFELSRVYVKNGFKCASDGRVAVMVKCDEPDTEGKFPNLTDCFGGTYTNITPIQIKQPVTLECECQMCINGRVWCNYQECVLCHGTGRCACGCPTEHDCFDCDGRGGKHTEAKTCRFCEGINKGFSELEIMGNFYKGHYVRLAQRELPNLKAVGIGKQGMLIFEFDGGQCAIMP